MNLNIPGPSLNFENNYAQITDNPFSYMSAARKQYGDVVLLANETSLFSRQPNCVGSVGVFGHENIKQVLLNSEVFGMPIPTTHHNTFSLNLSNLSAGLFSMSGEKHQHRHRIFSPMFNPYQIEAYHDVIIETSKAFFENWQPNNQIALLSEMRHLGLILFDSIIFGHYPTELGLIGSLIQRLLQLRRAYFACSEKDILEKIKTEMITVGEQIDTSLRRRIQYFRQQNSPKPMCLLEHLCTLKNRDNALLSENELVAQSNVFFLAGNEPFAVSLSWTILLLSRFPSIRSELRLQLNKTSSNTSELLEWVIKESLRLMPPNAFMVRITKETTSIENYHIPKNCEIIISPYISHRDTNCFPRPDEFIPQRWQLIQPSSFDYFPFGVGPKSCLGRQLATYTLKIALAQIIQRWDLELAYDQAIDWQLNITLMPKEDIQMRICPVRTSINRLGVITGSLCDLIPTV